MLNWKYYQYSLETKAWKLPEIVSSAPALALYARYYDLVIIDHTTGVKVKISSGISKTRYTIVADRVWYPHG